VGERRRAVRPGYRRLSVFLPEDLYLEIHGIAGRSVSGWIEQVLRERLEAEKRKRMLGLLPEPLREKLVKTAGSEEAAVHLLAKVIERGLAEIEEDEVEEAAQEAIGFVHRQERREEMKARS
jgi:histone H3/H4